MELRHKRLFISCINEAMLQWKNNREITNVELADLGSCMRVVARYITDGNEIEYKMVKAMGGEIIELPSDRLREAEEKIAELSAAAKETEEKIAKLNKVLEEADARAEEADARANHLQKSNDNLLVELRAYKEKFGNL